MGLKTEKILKIGISTSPKKEILEYIQKYLKNRVKLGLQSTKLSLKPLIITTPNPEQIVYAREHSWFADILNRADVAIPDGIGLIWAAKILGQKTPKVRIPGVELVRDLVSLAAEKSVPIALIGGRAGLAVKALECLRQNLLKLTGWATEAPRFLVAENRLMMPDGSLATYVRELAERIKNTQAKVIFVGLGAPKQELLLQALSDELKDQVPIVLMAVGGSFEILAGQVKRAPQFMRDWGWEWLWRLSNEPWRWRRQLALFRFIWMVMREKISKK